MWREPCKSDPFWAFCRKCLLNSHSSLGSLTNKIPSALHYHLNFILRRSCWQGLPIFCEKGDAAPVPTPRQWIHEESPHLLEPSPMSYWKTKKGIDGDDSTCTSALYGYLSMVSYLFTVYQSRIHIHARRGAWLSAWEDELLLNSF